MKDYSLNDNGKNIALNLINPAFKNKDGFIVYYSPTCPHCVNFAPTVNTLADQLKKTMNVGAIDCSDVIHGNDLLADFFNISGYPTIKFYNSVSGEYIDYTGGRNVEDMLSFICKVRNVCGPMKRYGGGKNKK